MAQRRSSQNRAAGVGDGPDPLIRIRPEEGEDHGDASSNRLLAIKDRDARRPQHLAAARAAVAKSRHRRAVGVDLGERAGAVLEDDFGLAVGARRFGDRALGAFSRAMAARRSSLEAMVA